MHSFNWVFENQSIASVVLTQPNRYKKAESNLLADKKVLNRSDYTSIPISQTKSQLQTIQTTPYLFIFDIKHYVTFAFIIISNIFFLYKYKLIIKNIIHKNVKILRLIGN